MNTSERRYRELLSEAFPTQAAASAALLELTARLTMPKETELFASDLHGEHDAFDHLLRNGSGALRPLIDAALGDGVGEQEKAALASLICYPQEKMAFVLPAVEDEGQWLTIAIERLFAVLREAASSHGVAQVRALLASEFAPAVEELLAVRGSAAEQRARQDAVIAAAVRAGRGAAFVEALASTIQRLGVRRVHIVGDVYDRGPAPDAIMDALASCPALDIQWGNHDIVWMGAALGQRGCIAHVVRNCARYGNLSILQDAYGIDLGPLAAFAQNAYGDDPCVAFGLKGDPGLSPEERELNVKIQKAMAILQFKVEARIIADNPGFGLEERNLLHRIDPEKGTVEVDGMVYELTDTMFPTVDWADPYGLTSEEEVVMQSLERAFVGSERLQRHMALFLKVGSLYKICDDKLLFHASVPLNDDGSLKQADVFGETYEGKALYDVLERYVRAAYESADAEERRRGRDLMWWLWLSPASPLFAKSKMATFELYLIAEKEARKEVKNPFYGLLGDPEAMAVIFEDFAMDPRTSRIVCGHVPVKAKDGEDPVKGGGRVLTIDGGFSRAYQPTTGIAGYTLIANAEGLVLAAHEPLESKRAAVERDADIRSTYRVIERAAEPVRVADTESGAQLKERIADLEWLIGAYRSGTMAEREGSR